MTTGRVAPAQRLAEWRMRLNATEPTTFSATAPRMRLPQGNDSGNVWFAAAGGARLSSPAHSRAGAEWLAATAGPAPGGPGRVAAWSPGGSWAGEAIDRGSAGGPDAASPRSAATGRAIAATVASTSVAHVGE